MFNILRPFVIVGLDPDLNPRQHFRIGQLVLRPLAKVGSLRLCWLCR